MAIRSAGVPGEGSLILHSCGGTPRAWLGPKDHDRCRCGALMVPDQRFVKGHDYLTCECCQSRIGLCIGESVDDFLATIVYPEEIPGSFE